MARKPTSSPSAEAELAQARARIGELEEALRKSTRRVELHNEVALQFQNLFNPPALPRLDGINFVVKYQPCARVGGDLYDIFDLGNGCVGILVADIAGHGLASVFVTALAKMAFDAFRQNEYSPKRILERLNEHLVRHTLSHQFLTAFLCVIDLDTLRMKYVNAAHPCPVVCSGTRFEVLDTEGLCAGMFEDPRYEENEIQLAPEDRAVFFTRGILGMCNGEDKPPRDTQFYDVLRQEREAPLGELMRLLAADFDRCLGGAEQTEDLTLVGLELVKRKTQANRIEVPSEPQQIHRVEERILGGLADLNYGERVLFGVRLAVEEAVVNAMKHGNKMDKAKKVVVTYSMDDKECVISVADEGDGFDPASVPDPTIDENLELAHGRGMVLIRAYMDEVCYNDKGNCVTMRKKAPWTE